MSVIYDMPAADYHAHPAVSASQLKELDRSPAHYHARYVARTVPPKASPSMELGTTLHTALLEPGRFESEYIVAPKCDRRTKAGKEAWAEFQAQADDKTVITEDMRRAVARMCESILSHKEAKAFFAPWAMPRVEVTHFWADEETGIECKCRPDAIMEDGQLLEVKTAVDASRSGFRNAAARYRYHLQVAHYLAGVEAVTGRKPPGKTYVVVEPEPPYAVAVYQPDAEYLEAGWVMQQRLLRTLSMCRATGEYPGYSDEIMPLSLPAWAREEAT